MFLRRQMLIAERSTFGMKMEQAAGEPTRTCLTEDIPKVSTDTKKFNQNQIRGKSGTYITARN